jgi:hypothetical protein
MVICDVLPMDACHLLLKRSSQYDRGATHDGRTNTYSFWVARKRRVLREMFGDVMRMDDHVQFKYNVATKKLKPRTDLLQEGGDDVATRAS